MKFCSSTTKGTLGRGAAAEHPAEEKILRVASVFMSFSSNSKHCISLFQKLFAQP